MTAITDHTQALPVVVTPRWYDHEPRWALAQYQEDDNPVYLLTACESCGTGPEHPEYGVAWFAHHIAELGAPAYMQDYWAYWASIVEQPHARVDRDLVARELSDFQIVMHEASLAYDELTGGRLSKPNTAARHVIAFAQERFAEQHAAHTLDVLLGLMESDSDRAAVIEFANDLHLGAYDEHQELLRRRADLAAQREQAARPTAPVDQPDPEPTPIPSEG